MSIRYHCYYCKEIFPAEESIDGYDRGYKVGFLCPRCGKNIQAGLLAKRRTTREQIRWIIVLFLLYLPVLFTRGSEVELQLFGGTMALDTLFVILWIGCAAVLFLVKPSLFKNTTFLTEPVE